MDSFHKRQEGERVGARGAPRTDDAADAGVRRILFIGLFSLSELYVAIARRLPPDTFRIFWISTNEQWTGYLVAHGVRRDDILELIYRPGDFLDETARETLTPQITRCEQLSGLSVNQVLMMDRFLNARPRPDINEHVYLYYRDIKRFLQARKVSCVFAEPTNAGDLLTYMICRELNIRYLSPRDMRYPPKRLVFFEGFRQDNIVSRTGDQVPADGCKLIEEFARSQVTPYYFARLNRMRVIYPGKIARAAIRRLKLRSVVSGHSLTHYDAWGLVKKTIRRAVNSFYLRRLRRYDNIGALPGKLAFFGLHVQPENSIDVLGPFVSDQLKLIKDIRRALPFDVTLVVKEHPNFLGLKSAGFFRQIGKIPNVRLIRHDVSTFDIYRRVSLVITISGTAAYEAGLLGIPAVTFSPMYFGGLSSVVFCPDTARLQEQVQPLLDGFQRDFDADCTFMESLVQKSFDAYWADPLFDRSVLEPENIARLAAAFMNVLGHDRD